MGIERDDATFKVVVNDEDQYSIWPDHKPTPAGWRDVGKVGNREDCQGYIDAMWTVLRPLSLRKFLDNQGG